MYECELPMHLKADGAPTYAHMDGKEFISVIH